MIAAWMLYTVAVTLLLYAAARAAEHLARATGAPTRFVWVAAIAAAFVLSGRALTNGRQARPRAASETSAAKAVSATAATPATAAVSRTVPRAVQHLLIIKDDAMRAPAAVSRRVNVAPLDRWNDVLLALWIAASAIAIAYLFALLARLRSLESRLRPGIVDARAVLLSNDVGPAVLGMIRSRIVLPQWVLSLPRHERHIILAHEREHADAFDPALLCAAALAIALQPWNAGLWAMVTRLKLAIESDCDRRVLGEGGDARTYGRLLVAVYQRTMHGHTPYVAFVQRPSDLERRILRLTRAPRLLSVGAGAAAVAATVLCTAAWVAPTPSRAAIVRTLQHVDQAQQSMPMSFIVPPVQVASASAAADNAMPLIVDAPPELVAAPVGTTQRNPCLLEGMGAAVRPPPPDGCTIDGDILVLALDDSHILITARDSKDVAFDSTNFVIFGTTPGAVPSDMKWSTRTGHLKIDTDWYIASPSPERRATAFIRTTEADTRYPDALHFRMAKITVQRNRGVTWDVLRQLPTAPRCSDDQVASYRPAAGKPIFIIVDGVVVDQSGPCFVADGKAVFLW